MPLSSRGGGKALVAGPLKKHFFSASLAYCAFVQTRLAIELSILCKQFAGCIFVTRNVISLGQTFMFKKKTAKITDWRLSILIGYNQTLLDFHSSRLKTVQQICYF